jgi:NADH-quinone oxidoreductase subunit B
VIQDTQAIVVIEGEGLRLGVLDASLACCALETRSALLAARLWVDEELDGLALLVSGTISQKLVQGLLDLVAAFIRFSPELPHFLVAVGACATSGGPYWDSLAVVAGLDVLGLPCDLYIPGCPPRPTEILAGVIGLMKRAEAL